jgi:hypothetical protein
MFTPSKRTLSAVALIAALSAPSTASAMINRDPGGAPAPSRQPAPPPPYPPAIAQYQQAIAKSLEPTAGGLAGLTAPARTAPNNSVRRTSASSPEGFRWDDAGIGAAGALALIGIGSGAAGAARRRRVHQAITG